MDRYPDGSWQSVDDEINKSLRGHSEPYGPKPKTPAKPVKEIKTSQSKVKKSQKNKKAKSWLNKIFNKLKIKSGGSSIGGQMPVTDHDLKKIGARRSKVNK